MKVISIRNLSGLTFALTLGVASFARAQTGEPPQVAQGTSIALESDAISFFIGGYSGIVNVSLRNGFQIALGTGRYDVPSFLLKGDDNYDAAQWDATVTSVQVLRAGYRFNGPMVNGPALAAVALNQNWLLRSAPLGGETKFRTLSVGLSGGYYYHIGNFYIYPTAAFTYNTVQSGQASVNGTPYKVDKFGPNASVHVGWNWRL